MADPQTAHGTASVAIGAADPASDLQREIDAECLVTVYELTLWPIVAGIAFAVFLAAVVATRTGDALPWIWLAVKLFTGVLRCADVARWRHDAQRRVHTDDWRRRYAVLLMLDSLVWGALPVLLLQYSSGVLSFLLLGSVIGVAAIGVYTLVGLFEMCVIFLACTLVPAALHQTLRGGDEGGLFAIGLSVYFVLLVFESRRAAHRHVELLRLRFDNARIADERSRALLLAEHSNAAKSRFLAAVSHELRTPLNGILGMTQLLQAGPVDVQAGQRLEVVRKSAHHLRALIDDLLDLSRIEFGRFQIDQAPFALEPGVREVTDLLAPLALDKGLGFDVEIDPALPRWLSGDASRIKQVLHNLIGNAIKFTTTGRVMLKVACDGERIRITVRDSGPGIASDQLGQIFDAFTQAGAESAVRRAGAGLGLTIARQLARAMGGDIVCSSALGVGSTFTVTLPLVPAPPSPAADGAATTAADPDGLHGQVLVVDDNPVNALVAQAMLEHLGMAVEVVDNGAAALDRLAADGIDAVLMDCEMPTLNGWEATRRWREIESASGAKARLPIIALTANAVAGDRERCIAAGMDNYLAKPFELVDLAAVMRSVLGGVPRSAGG